MSLLQGDKLQQAAQLANLKYGAEAQPYLEAVLIARYKVITIGLNSNFVI